MKKNLYFREMGQKMPSPWGCFLRKWGCMLFFVLPLFSIQPCKAQTPKISLRLQNTSLKQIFDEIEKQSDYTFLYNDKIIDVDQTTSVNVEDNNIAAVLDKVLKNTNILYTLVDKQIVLNSNNSKFQQLQKISGKIEDEKGEALIGAAVSIKGTTIATISDANGKYSIDVSIPNAVLVYSYIGYIPKEVTLYGLSVVDVNLEPEVKKLEEVVVVGYGTQQKKDLTGSVSSIEAKGFGSIPVPSIGDAMEGRAAGVQVISSGQPGTDATFRIRGTGTVGLNVDGDANAPLLVIDGVPVGSGLNQLNSDDIESLQVLKDASATAIYGSRGANGVIIITTKRGKADQSHINFKYFFGLQQATNMVKMLNASQFAALHNDIMANAGLATNPAWAKPDTLGVGANWLGALFRLAPIQNYSLSYSGGTDKSTFYVSGNIIDQEGIIIGTGFKKYSIQFNTDTKVFERVKFGNSLTLENDIKPSGDYDILSTMESLPTQSIYNKDGSYTIAQNPAIWYSDLINPIGRANTVKKTTKGYNVIGSIYGQIDILKDLHFKSNLGLQANFWDDRTWSPALSYNVASTPLTTLYEQYNKSITWLWDNYFTYDKVFNNIHHFTLMAGTSAQANRYDFLNGNVSGFQSLSTQQINNGLTVTQLRGDASEWALFSYMSRLNYSYNDKYLATATIRRDGSSKFGENNKYGLFPSMSLAWRVSKENFFKEISFINDLKLRGGYGVTGNQNINSYGFASSLVTNKYVFNNNSVSAIYPTTMPNPNMQWEGQKESDMGIDVTFLKERITLTFDGYIKNTDKMLVPQVVPNFSGYNQLTPTYLNAGKLQNKGIEIMVNSKNLVGEFTWSTNFNFSLNRNKIISLNDTIPISAGSIAANYSLSRYQAGHPINEFYGYVTDGIFQTSSEVANHAVQTPGTDPATSTAPGDIRFKDLNNDGKIDASDRAYIGNPNPKFIFAMNNIFTYKGFDLSIFFQGTYGNKIFNANRLYTEAMDVAQNQTVETLNRWTGAGTSNSMPRAIFGDPNGNTLASDRYIEDGSYLRIKNLTLGYTLPEKLIQRISVTSARLYASMQNIYTFTKYKGFDPEVPANGIDNNVYPVTRTISFGINLSF